MSTGLRLLTFAALAVAIAGCPQPKPTGTPTLTMVAKPDSINSDGATTDLTITGTDETGGPMVGSVTLAATAGTFTPKLVTLVNGTGTASYACNKAKDPKCTGLMVLSAQSGSLLATTTVTLIDQGQVNVQVASDKPSLVTAVGNDSAVITVTVKRGSNAFPDQSVKLEATNATGPAGTWDTTTSATVTKSTGADGAVSAVFHPGSAAPGPVTIKATVAEVSGSTTVNLTPPSVTIKFAGSATCAYAGIGRANSLTAQITNGTSDVAAVLTLQVTTPSGMLAASGGTPSAKTLTLTTDANGQAPFDLYLDTDPLTFPATGTSQGITSVMLAGEIRANTTKLADISAPVTVKQIIPVVSSASSSPKLEVGVGDSLPLTVQLHETTPTGLPLTFSGIQIDVDAAGTAVSDGANTSPSLTVSTDATGKASFTVLGPTQKPTASIPARATVKSGVDFKQTFTLPIAYDVPKAAWLPTQLRTTAYTGLSDFVDLKLELQDSNGISLGRFSGVQIPVTASAHQVQGSGTPSKSVTTTTDASGQATVRFSPSNGDSATSSTLSAALPVQTTASTLAMTVQKPKIGWSSTTLLNAMPAALGDVQQVTAEIQDSSTSQPLTGVVASLSSIPLNFSVKSGPGTFTPTNPVQVLTDAKGAATAGVSIGTVSGSVVLAVTAVGTATGGISDGAGTIVVNPTRVTLSAGNNQVANLPGAGLPLSGQIEQQIGGSWVAVARSGVSITFATDNHLLANGASGAKSVTATTNASGIATATFAPSASDLSTTAKVTAYVTAAGATATPAPVAYSVSITSPKVALSASPAKIPGSVAAYTTLTAQIVDANGVALTNSGISISFDPGTVGQLADATTGAALSAPTTVTTDANGQAKVRYVATGAGTDASASVSVTPKATIAASGVSATTSVTIDPLQIDLKADSSILYNGVGDKTTLHARLWYGGAVQAKAGVSVKLNTGKPLPSHGFLDAVGNIVNTITLTTNALGEATVLFAPDVGDTSTSASVTWNLPANNVNGITPLALAIAKPGLSFLGTPPNIVVGIGAQQKFLFQLTNASGTPLARSGVSINFSVVNTTTKAAPQSAKLAGDTGSGIVTLQTDTLGQVTAVLNSGSTAEPLTVTASAPGITSGTATANLVQANLTISLSKSSVYNGLTDTVDVTAQLRDLSNAPLNYAGVDVSVSTTAHQLTLGTVISATWLHGVTDASGKLVVKLVPVVGDANASTTLRAALGNAAPSSGLTGQVVNVVKPKLAFVGTLPVMQAALGDTATLTAQIQDPSTSLPITSVPVSGVAMTFAATTPGSFMAGAPATSTPTVQMTSLADGTAAVTFAAGTTSGVSNLTVTALGMTSATGSISINALRLSFPAQTNIVNNYVGETLPLNAQLEQQTGATTWTTLARNNVNITWEVSLSNHLLDNGGSGSKSITNNTNAQGIAAATFVPFVGEPATAANVIAYVTAEGKTSPVPVVFAITVNALTLSATANPTSLTSGLGSTATITAQLKNGTNNVPKQGVAIDFSTDLGGFQVGAGSAKTTTLFTDATGKATATFVTGSDTGTAHLVVSRTGMPTNATATITLTGTGVNLSASPLKLYQNVGDSAQLTAQLTANGQPSPTAGQTITFATDFHLLNNGTTTGKSLTATTDSTGKATMTFQPDTADTATAAAVTASTGANTSVPQTIQVATLSLAVTSSAATMTTGVNQTASITVQLMDGTTAVPRSNVAITLTTDLGQLTNGTTTGATVTVNTDAAGKATATFLTGTTPGTANLTASRARLNNGTAKITLQPVNVVIATAKPALYTGINDSTTGTVTLSAGTTALTNTTFSLGTSLGTLVGPGGSGTSIQLTTDTSGVAAFTLQSGTVTGNATLSATYAGGTGTLVVPIKPIDSVAFVSASNTSLGVNGSGINETSVLTFKVMSGSTPVGAGIPVTFALTANTGTPPSPTAATFAPASATTNASGQVAVTVTSGTITGILTVQATSATASTNTNLPVHWNRPSEGRMVLSCAKVNLDVYNPSTTPKSIDVGCTVKLNERDGSTLQVDTSIKLLSEAGSQPPQLTLPGSGTGFVTFNYNTAAGNPVPNTPLAYRPAIVDTTFNPPYEVLPVQPAEPAVGNAHPRGHYVTLIAWAWGEEDFADTNTNGIWDDAEPFVDVASKNGVYDPPEPFADANGNGKYDVGELFLDINGNGVWDDGEPFTDLNGNGIYEPWLGDTWNPATQDTLRKNGVWDPGETFTDLNGNKTWDKAEPLTDLGEPFVDSNDNGWWDPGELYQDVNGDGKWNPPNGKWDRVTGIWKPVTFVFTSLPALSLTPWSVSVPVNGTGQLFIDSLDDYLNPPADISTYTITRTGTRGTYTVNWFGPVVAGSLKDSTFGGTSLVPAGPQRTQVGLHLGSKCGPQQGARESTCIWKTYFQAWPRDIGPYGVINLAGATTPGTAETDTFTATCSTNGGVSSTNATVIFQ